MRSTLKERYGKEVEPQLADIEVILGSEGHGVVPGVVLECNGANFVVKIGAKCFRAYFYYHPEHRLGTGIDSYDEIGDCVINVLQVESDHMRKQKISTDQQPAQSAENAPEKPDLTPNFWGD